MLHQPVQQWHLPCKTELKKRKHQNMKHIGLVRYQESVDWGVCISRLGSLDPKIWLDRERRAQMGWLICRGARPEAGSEEARAPRPVGVSECLPHRSCATHTGAVPHGTPLVLEAL